MSIHSSILARENPMDRGDWLLTVHRVTKNWTQRSARAHTHTKADSRLVKAWVQVLPLAV